MKFRTCSQTLACFVWLASACAAAPTVQGLQISSVILGGSVNLQASVNHSGGNLVSATFYVSGPAVRDPANLDAITWPTAQAVGTWTPSGSQVTPQVTWQPQQVGTYAVTVYVSDQAATASQTGICECVSGQLTVPATTVASGTTSMDLYPGEILNQENDTSSNVVVQNGGNLIFWSGGRVDLKPGFHASTGSFFWAAVDHNMNGLSDVEEATSTAGDGIPDAWKVEHGLSIGVAYPQYRTAYLAGYDPSNKAATTGLPTDGSVQLVIKTPVNGYYGVNTSSWSISPATPNS
jgi:hypothetical protein